MMKHILSLLLFCICCSHLFAQQDTSRFKERDNLARQQLATFSTTLNESNFRNFGFDSMDDLRNATLGLPFEMAMIRLDQLQNYRTGTDPQNLIIRTTKYIYPVINNRTKQAVNAITVVRNGLQWSVASIGRDKAAAIAAYNQTKGRPSNHFIANIPALSVSFVSYFTGSSLMMVPVTSDSQNNIQAGEPSPAIRIFNIYSGVARRYNGLPGS